MSQGGGFYTNANSSPYSQSSPGGGDPKRGELAHSVRPLTIAQVLKAKQAHTDAEWTVGGNEIGQVTIVGQVVNVNQQATNSVYMIEDGTGTIETRHWNEHNSEEDAAKWGNIEQNNVIRVTGNLKSFGQKKYINANGMRLSEDPHEIYYHISETITVTLTLQNGLPSGQAIEEATGGGNTSAYTAQSSASTGVDLPAEYKNLPALQRGILRAILAQPGNSDGGVFVGDIAKAVEQEGGATDISSALDELMDAGHIYSTSDDAHFQVSR